jgi:hypothetical protein
LQIDLQGLLKKLEKEKEDNDKKDVINKWISLLLFIKEEI